MVFFITVLVILALLGVLGFLEAFINAIFSFALVGFFSAVFLALLGIIKFGLESLFK